MSIGTDGMLYYHTINMDQNNGRGDVSAKNQLLDMANADYKDLMLAVEDPEAGLNHLYAARGTADLDGAAAGELEVLRYTFKGEIDGLMSYRSLFGYTNSFGLSDMQLSHDHKHLLVYNLTGLPEGFTGARTAEVYIYRLDDAYEPVDETPQHIDLPEGTTPNSSAVFMEDNQTVVISTRSVSGDRLLSHNLAANTTTIAVEGTAGTLTTGRDGRLYVSPAGTTTTLAYESDMSPATGWTYDHTLTGIRSFTAYKALDKGATGSVLASRRVGFKTYELKDLPIVIGMGNVRVLVSDRMKAVSDGNGETFTDARVQAFNNYYPFGMLQTQRSQSATEYRFGFNGKEKDPEFQNNYDYGFRIYNPAIARFLSVDPLTKEYPWYTPYQFAGNTPVQAIDLEGKEPQTVVEKGLKDLGFSEGIKIYTDKETGESSIIKTSYIIHKTDSKSATFYVFNTLYDISSKGNISTVQETRKKYEVAINNGGKIEYGEGGKKGIDVKKLSLASSEEPIVFFGREAQEYVDKKEPLVSSYATLVKVNPDIVKSGQLKFNTWSTSEMVEDVINFIQDVAEVFYFPWWTSPPGTDDGYLRNHQISTSEEYKISLDDEDRAASYFSGQKDKKVTIINK